MYKPSLRVVLKSGPFGSVYSKIRGIKRKLRREPVSGMIHEVIVPLNIDQLLRLRDSLDGHARYHYSLGLAYFERNNPGDAELSLSSFEQCLAMGFDSPERARLSIARLMVASGNLNVATENCRELIDDDFTPSERELLQQLLWEQSETK